MKFPILILTLLACTTTMHAQNPRIETFGDRRTETYTYKIGMDSIRFTILGKADTLQTTKFYRSGKPSQMSWKKDSSVEFDMLGRKKTQSFSSSHKKRQLSRFNIEGIVNDSFRSYYTNGQIFEHVIGDGLKDTRKAFDEEGVLIATTETVRTNNRKTINTKDKNGVYIAASRIDSLKNGETVIVLMQDTLFHLNGRPFQVSSYKNSAPNKGVQYFDESGKLVYSGLTDSLRLSEFKDNVDCYYGLKNIQEDTIVKPRFDRIEKYNDDFFAAYTGESAILLDNKGAPITPPVDRLSKIERLEKHYDHGKSEQASNEPARMYDYYEEVIKSNYFRIMEDKNHGVMSAKGALIMPPQYLSIDSRYVGEGTYFGFTERIKDSIIRAGYLNRQGKSIFDTLVKNTRYSEYKDYFYLSPVLNFDNDINRESWYFNESQKALLLELAQKNTVGLGRGDGSFVLPIKFASINRVRNTALFVTTLIKTNQRTQVSYTQHGIFDAQRKTWLLDTTHFSIDNKLEGSYAHFVIKNVNTQKFGIMDTTGKYAVPLSYDSIGVASLEKGLFWVKKGSLYQILTINGENIGLSKQKYAYLSPVRFDVSHYLGSEEITYFVAKIKDKWGIIDAKEQVVKPFDYDYAANGQKGYNYYLLVKNNQVQYFDIESLPNATDNWTSVFHAQKGKKGVISYTVLDNSDGIFFVNEIGKVVIPPQYKPLDKYINDNYVLVEDAKKQRKIIFFETSKVFDYPFDYPIQLADAKSKVIGVYDTTQPHGTNYGIVSTDGKVLVPCVNYGIAIGDIAHSAFFVKRDTFPIPEDFYENRGIVNTFRRSDTLTIEDNDWLLHDSTGKIANSQPFRYAIDFRKGFGVGMQTNGFQLFKYDGTVIAPFEKKAENSQNSSKNTGGANVGYTNIWRMQDVGFYAFFRNQGLTPTLILTKDNGEILIPSGQFDGISKFYDKYALVTAAGKVGLVDTFGRMVIAPQDLRTYQGQFMDSLDIVNAQNRKKPTTNFFTDYEQPLWQPISYDPQYHPDSLAISTAQRQALWNLMLEKCLKYTITTASEVSIKQTPLKAASGYFDNNYRYEAGIVQVSARPIIISEKTISFCFSTPENLGAYTQTFHNFYRRDNRWEELNINDLLQIQGEKRWLLNDLLTQKIKALKDVSIDCSNASAFIGQAENRFMVTKEGVNFCFKSTASSHMMQQDFVVIPFTWAELTPFLRMKIF